LIYSTRSKLVLSFLGVALLVCGVALVIGGQLLYKGVLNEATNRVRLDLNAARELYLNQIRKVKIALDLTASSPSLLAAIERRDLQTSLRRLQDVAKQTDLDFMGIMDANGRILCRIGPNPLSERPMRPIQ
jgi:two-component system NtrC family sensor kinase